MESRKMWIYLSKMQLTEVQTTQKPPLTAGV